MVLRLKKIMILSVLVFFAGVASLFAEKLTLKTGDVFGFSQTDYFYPLDKVFMTSHSSVASVSKAENIVWCIKISVCKNFDAGAPSVFEYYVREGDVIKVKRFLRNEQIFNLKVLSLNWNEVTFDVLQ